MEEERQGKESRADGYINLMNKYGTRDDASEQYRFQSEGPVTDIELTLNYEENGLFSKIIDIPAEDAASGGFTYGITDEGLETFIQDSLEELDFEQKASAAMKWSRLYGGALIVMVLDDGGKLIDPVNWDGIRGIDDLLVFERSLVSPDYNSIYKQSREGKGSGGKVKFGMPEFYDIFPVYGHTFRVHESRCLLFKNGELPQSSTRTEYRFFGLPEYIRIHKALQEAVTSHGNGVKLLDRAIQAIYRMNGLAALLDTDEGEDIVLRRLRIIDMAKGLINSIAIDAQGEDYDYKTVTFSGVKDVIDAACNMLSAVTNIPQTKLFGRSPAGENATGEGDMENYYTFVRKIQKLNLKRNLGTLINVILAVGKYKGELKEIPKFKLEFKPLWSLSEKEQAEVGKVKADTELVKAQAAQVYVDMQALDASEVRERLAEGGEFTVNDILQEREDWTELQEPFTEGESEETSGTALSAEPDLGQGKEAIKMDAAAPTGCGVLVIKDGKVLVGNRKDSGLLCGPGGHIEPGERPEEAAVREAREEFGIYVAELIPFAMLSEMSPEYCPSQVFLCTEFFGEPVCLNSEMEQARFEAVSDILKQDLFLPFQLSVQELMKQFKPCYRNDDKWITTKQGKHVQINEKGEVVKGHPASLGDKTKSSSENKGEKQRKKAKTVDYKAAREYSKVIKGINTMKGTVIKSVTPHAAYRMKERRFSPEEVRDFLSNATISYPGNSKHSDAECYQYKRARIVVSKEGVIITVIDLEGYL